MSDNGGRAEARLAAQNAAVRALVRAGSTEEGIPELLREVCSNLGWCLGEVWCPEPGDRDLARLGAWSLDGLDAFHRAEAGTAREPGSFIARVARSGAAEWVPDVQADTGFARTDAARAAGIHTAFAVPVPLDDQGVGVLAFFADEARERDPALIESMEAVAGHLGQFLRRRRIEHELRATEERLRFQARLLDTVAEAVIVTDMDGRIVYWNAFAEQLYGWPARDVIGRPVDEVTPSVAARDDAADIMDRLRNGESWTGEFRVADRAGREFTALVNNSPIHDDDGRAIGVIGTSIDISDRKRDEERQRFLADAGRVLASSLDFETTIRSVAELAVPTLGDWCLVHTRVEAGDPVTRPVARVVPPDETDAAETLLRDVASDETGFVRSVLGAPGAVVGPTRDDEASPISEARLHRLGIRALVAVPLQARDAVIGVITFATTSSGRDYDDGDVQLAEELARRAALALDNARLYSEAQQASRAKADFLAVVSHELRTPLNAITGYADLLTAGVAGELARGQLHHVERIKIGAGHLAHIIDEVLAYARLESGRDLVQLEAADLGQILGEAVVVLEPDAADKGLPIHLELSDPPPRITTDAGKVRQIVVNLLSNAVKYTEEGEVRVRARTADGGAVIEVIDTGVGIEPRDQQRIFEPFWQAEAPNTRSTGGTGLGLSVNRRLLDLLGGSIAVRSEPGAGSTFTVRVPDGA